MPLFSFSKKNKESYSLVISIGSGSVTGAIIKFTKKPGVDVLYSRREILPLMNEVSVSKRLTQLKNSLGLLLSSIQKEGLKKLPVTPNQGFIIKKVFYIFSSPWSTSQTKVISVNENKAFKVTETYLTKLVEEEIKKDPAEAGKIIEKKIIQLKINGYVVSKTTGQLARELEVSLYKTVVPDEVISTVEGAVSKYFRVKEVWCHSLSLPVFSVIRDLFPHKDDFISIEVSDEMTDLCLVKDGIITSSASFPLGRNHFIKELANTMKVSPEIADSMMKVNASKVNDELAALKLSVAMNKSAEEWLKNISSIIDHWKEKTYVPETIFLISNNDLVSFITLKLKSQDFKFFLIDKKNIRSNDVVFKICLIFLDKLYKI